MLFRSQVQFRPGDLGAHLAEGQQGEVESLVPVEAAGKKDDGPPVAATPHAGSEHPGVGVIEEDGAPSGRARARGVALVPEVVGDDHVIRRRGRAALERAKQEARSRQATQNMDAAMERATDAVPLGAPVAPIPSMAPPPIAIPVLPVEIGRAHV